MESVLKSEARGDAFPVSQPSIWQKFLLAASLWPDRLAVASLHQPPGLYEINPNHQANPYLQWTYADLLSAVDRFSHNLAARGIKSGQTIATFLPNGIEFVVTFWAAHQLGATFVPLSPRSLINGREASYMLRVAKTSVVVVQDRESISAIDALGISLALKVCVMGARERHLPFIMLLQQSRQDVVLTPPSPRNFVTVLFTSGTSSLPKGCPHTDQTLNAFMANLALGGQSELDVFVRAVIYPGPSFEAISMLKALEAERCTHTCLVPTALHAVLEALTAAQGQPKLCLKDVCLAGSSVTPDNMRQVVHSLGSLAVSTGFCMTEGSPIWTGCTRTPEELIRGECVLVGSVAPGASVRICAPGSTLAIQRGEQGEIHQSGPGLIAGYIGIESESFYIDDMGRGWFVTGDQAIMYEDGKVSITGRYKDMIIRGGENIAPAAIEAILNTFDGVQAQIVAAADPIAGEVPVAIVQTLAKYSKKSLRDAVLQKMGPVFVPEEILTLSELGLDEYPKTTSGKIQKAELVSLVRKHRENQEAKRNPPSFVEKTVLEAWQKATGILSEHIDQNAPTTIFADSIAVMRVRDTVRKKLGISITAEEMGHHPSVRSQVEFLRHKNSAGREVVIHHMPPTSPTFDDMMLTFGGEIEAKRMRSKIEDTLTAKGFNWTDVAQIVPTHDYMQVFYRAGMINTWNFAIAIMANGSSVEQFSIAVESALSNNPILSSFCIEDQEAYPYYVTLKPSRKLFDICVIKHGTVAKPQDVQHLAIRYPYPEHATFPGPLFRCLVVHVEETSSAAMVMYVNHIVQDASFTRLVYEDIEQALLSPTQIPRPHVDFKLWADSYQALRLSPSATLSVKYHVNRLQDLHLHRKGLYPPAKVPREATQEDPDGLDFGFEAPGLIDLKTSYPTIIASTVLKAAMALVDVHRSSHTHALFNNFEAGRGHFPFLPPSTISRAPTAFEAADIGGPVMEGVTNLIEVAQSQKAIDFLTHLQNEQSLLTKHAHAPLRRVIEMLNSYGSAAGDMMVEIQRTHFLTWLPGFLGDYARIAVAQIAIRCKAGLVVVGGIGGPSATTYMISMRWDVANFDRERTMAYVQDLEHAVKWLTQRENWNKPLGEFIRNLGTSSNASN